MQPVGIVLVSHSATLVQGLCEMLAEVARGAAVEAAGGTQDGGLGTSDELIRAAIGRADRGAGVLVLADLGSSVLTARMVLDDLADSGRTDVLLADAPLVEGAVSAAVLASTGADLATVLDAAHEARTVPKF